MYPLVDIDDFKISFDMLWIKDDTPFLGETAKGVVLLVPVFNTSKRCWKVWEKAIYRLDPLPEKVIFCENNSTDDTLELINGFQLPHEVIRVWFKPDAAKGNEYEPIAHVRQLLLTRARTYGAKMAIFLDDDCIPEHKDFIQMFLNDNLDICGGSYTRDFPNGNMMASLWDIGMPIAKFPKTSSHKKDIENCTKAGYHILGYPYEILEKDGRKRFECSVTSAGALALGPKVLQDKRLDFYPLHPELSDSKEISEDFGFCLLAGTLGYKIYLDFTIKFAHLGGLSNNNEPKHRPWVIDERETFEF
jgi:hypothetical protein